MLVEHSRQLAVDGVEEDGHKIVEYEPKPHLLVECVMHPFDGQEVSEVIHQIRVVHHDVPVLYLGSSN